MALWKRKQNRKDISAVAEEDEETSSSEPVNPVEAEDADVAPLDEGEIVEAEEGDPEKKRRSIFGKFESKVRRKVDGYVDNKAGELMEDATNRAQQFRQETLDEVRANAMTLLDLTEERIDEKLVRIEAMLDKRLQAELKMRLRAMMWTLVFVLLMALVSFAYVYVKQSMGLEADNPQPGQSVTGE